MWRDPQCESSVGDEILKLPPCGCVGRGVAYTPIQASMMTLILPNLGLENRHNSNLTLFGQTEFLMQALRKM